MWSSRNCTFSIACLVFVIAQIGESAFAQSGVPSETIEFPTDANISNVKSFGAVGDGIADDTKAINLAIADSISRAEKRTSVIVYLPSGVYRVTGTVEALNGAGMRCSNLRLHGAGIGKTVIKLDDNADAFSRARQPKAVIATHGESRPRPRTGEVLNQGNTAFGNYVEHLTVDVGAGNRGAIGIHFKVANWGSLNHVEIVSSDPQKLGKNGLLIDDLSGPGLVKDVSITGFAVGIFLESEVNNIVFENIRLRDQKVYGIRNQNRNIAIRNLESNNAVPAIFQARPTAFLALVDATLTGDSQARQPAIVLNDSILFARNVKVKNYHVSIASTNAKVVESQISEWVSHPTMDINGRTKNQLKSVNLPVLDAPEYHSNDFATWANVTEFKLETETDYSKAFQRAIDSGKETIYFPYGKYQVDGPIVVRGKVKKINFLSAVVSGASEIRISDVENDFVILENWNTGSTRRPRDLIIDDDAAVVLRNIEVATLSIKNTARATRLFMENVGPHPTINLSHGIKAWFRQLNREWTPLTNDGATLWILGMNIEAKSNRRTIPSLKTLGSGVTEIIGGALDCKELTFADAKGSVFEIEKGTLSLTIGGFMRKTRRGTGYFENVITDTTLKRKFKHKSQIIVGDDRTAIPLFFMNE